MAEFAVRLLTKNELNENNEYISREILLETVSDTTVNESSTLTTHPVVSGDFIADHMFSNPSNVSFSGTLSQNGSRGLIVDNEVIDISRAQEFFKTLKKNGVRFDVTKVRYAGEERKSLASFETHTNMVLTNMTWVERTNSLNFSFEFTEAKVVEIREYEPSTSDSDLPDVTFPKTSSFTDLVIDWNTTKAAIIKIMNDNKMLAPKFYYAIAKAGVTGDYVIAAVGAAGAIGGAVVATNVLLAAAAGSSTAGPVGWIAAGVCLVGAAIAGIFAYSAKKKKQKHKYLFNYYEGDTAKNTKESERFEAFIEAVQKQLSILNDYISVYQIASNSAQECVMQIADNWYIFTFEKGVNNTWSLKCKDFTDEEKVIGECSDVSSAVRTYPDLAAVKPLFDVKDSDVKVYIMRIGEHVEDLTNYCIVSSAIKPKDFNSKMNKVIKAALENV